MSKGVYIGYVIVAVIFVIGYIVTGTGFKQDNIYITLLGSGLCVSSLTSAVWLLWWLVYSGMLSRQNEDVTPLVEEREDVVIDETCYVVNTGYIQYPIREEEI